MNNYICEICKEEFESEDVLKIHIKAKHFDIKDSDGTGHMPVQEIGKDKMKVVPICDGRAHLMNVITDKDKCYVCKKDKKEEDMVLLRHGEREMAFACLNHKGIIQEFLRQYNRPPLGWDLYDLTKKEAYDVTTKSRDKETTRGKDNPV